MPLEFSMPIYEYRCQKCGQFEIMQKITEPALKKCPTCRSKVTKLISNTSFQLKGSGWYATDYARSGNGEKSKESKESSTSSESSSTESTSSETKTESKAGKKEAAAA